MRIQAIVEAWLGPAGFIHPRDFLHRPRESPQFRRMNAQYTELMRENQRLVVENMRLKAVDDT